MFKVIILYSLLLSAYGCTSASDIPVSAGMGPNPVLPAPVTSVIPTVKIAPAVGCPKGDILVSETPTA